MVLVFLDKIMSDTAIPEKDFLEVKDIKNYFNNNGIDIAITTIYNWCDMGTLESQKIGGKVFVKREIFFKFMMGDRFK